MVGRCADYALSDWPDCFSIFIHADMDARIRRIASKYGKTDKEAKDIINKTDKEAEQAIIIITPIKNGDLPKIITFCIDSGKLGLDNAAKVIIDAIQIFDASKKK